MDDDGVEVLVHPPLGLALPATWLARKDVVGGQHERGRVAARRAHVSQQVPIQMLDGEPLEVHDVGRARGGTVAEHVRHVLGELAQHSQARSSPARSDAVEELASQIPLGRGHVSVGEAARVQLDLGSRRRQRAAQRVVVGRRVGRGVDDVDAHGRDNRCARGDNTSMTAAEPPAAPLHDGDSIELSYCVVNTSQRELLVRGLDAIERERGSVPFATEVLVLDNGSRDGSAQAAREHPAVDQTIALPERRGKALNDSELLRRARGRFALLLNEDSELRPGATRALHEALAQHPGAACAGARLVRPDGVRAGLGVALPDGGHRRRGRSDAASPADRPEQRTAHARGRLVPVGRAAREACGRRGGRLSGP